MRRRRTLSTTLRTSAPGVLPPRGFGRQVAPRAMPQGGYEAQRSAAPTTTFFFMLLVTFLIAFPKGGMKMGNFPLTIGYLTLGLVTFIALPRFLMSLNKLPQNALTAWLLTTPFYFILIATYLYSGVQKDSAALLLMIFASFVFMPAAFLLILAPSAKALEPDKIKWALVFAIRFICIFGIVLFTVKTFTGYTIEVPFLTVNLDDTDVLGSKNNTRGELFKLISTYNNGNIFGVCLGIMLPLYYFLEKKRIFFIIAVVCMVLTLSRTAWIALVLILMAIAWIEGLKPARIAGLGILALVFIAALPLLVEAMGRDSSSFLFDTSLGNRSSQLERFSDFHLEPRAPISNINEMVYASIYSNYGLFGLISFLLFLGGPVLVTMTKRKQSVLNRAAAAGLLIYMIVAMSDGAILLIPVTAIYFFIALFALEMEDDDPGLPDVPPPSQLPAQDRGFRRSRFQAGR
ncbi:O-antigen ligase family protein [Xanthobacter sp. KR7-225]|uniref:O-antigen ligase family protein n=1 Tax=Xanthobacter sp. KR7-225 TaxID=3156613 RepID=UPI0032B55677